MIEDLKYLVDEDGHRYDIDKELGRGGQGVVYKLRNENLVAKVKYNLNPLEYQKFKKDVLYLSTLRLPENIKIVSPISFLEKPHCGYIMRLVDNMIPLADIIKPLDGDSIKTFYIDKTGGLFKRLKVLRNLAHTLETLRSLSIVYADLSPFNIYVSEDIDKAEVWLIDPDNMRYTMDFDRQIVTPDYGAPEVVSGLRNNDVFSDNYSFALIAFEFLSFTMPFSGNMVLNPPPSTNDDDDWADSDDSMYNKALKGLLPWIFDRDDTSNSLEIKYFPEGFEYCPSNLLELFHKTFSYEGRNDPNTRTSMREWYIELSRALDELYICKNCGASFHYKITTCPFCNEEREKLFLLRSFKTLNVQKIIRDVNIEEEEIKAQYANIINNLSAKTVRRRVLNNLSFSKIVEDIINIDIYNYDTSFIKFLDDREVLFRLTKDNDSKFYYERVSDNINLAYFDGDSVKYADINVKYRIPSLDKQQFFLFFKSLKEINNIDDSNTSEIAYIEDHNINDATTFYRFIINLV